MIYDLKRSVDLRCLFDHRSYIHLRGSCFLGRDIWHIFDVKQVGNRLDGCFYCSLISPCQVGRVTCAPRHPQPRMSTGPIHSFLLSLPLFELNLLGVSFDLLLCNLVLDTSLKFKGWENNDSYSSLGQKKTAYTLQNQSFPRFS